MVGELRKAAGAEGCRYRSQPRGLAENLVIDRATASRMNITPDQIDSTTLYDAFGQRQISTLYTQFNQYHVILEASPEFQRDPQKLQDIYLQNSSAQSSASSGSATASGRSFFQQRVYSSKNPCGLVDQRDIRGRSGRVYQVSRARLSCRPTRSPLPRSLQVRFSRQARRPACQVHRVSSLSSNPFGTGGSSATSASASSPIPLSAIARFEKRSSPLTIAHQGQFPVVTISFDLAPNTSLSQGVAAVENVKRRLGMPASVLASFQGTAEAYKAIGSNEALLILAALVAVYIVLGILYESFLHPITILSQRFLRPESARCWHLCSSGKISGS